MKQEEFSATTIPGLETEVAKEIQGLHGEVIQEGSGFVTFRAHPYEIPNILTHSRLILRVLEPIATGDYKTLQDLLHRISFIDWSRFIQPSQTFKIDFVGRTTIAANQYAVLTVKDVLVDNLKQKYGKRPSIDTRNPDHLFILYFKDTHCTIYRDAAGTPLSQRGYRTQSLEAPINEVIAAGLLSLLGWEGKGLLIDPMCGSGTIVLEALTKALSLFPQTSRKKGFGLDRWPDRKNYGLKPGITTSNYTNHSNIPTTEEHSWKILGADRDPEFRSVFEQNLTHLLEPNRLKRPEHLYLEVEHFEYLHANPYVQDSREWAEKLGLPTILCFNPPYDQRLALENTREFYSNLGDILKQHWKNSLVGIISGSVEGIKHVGLRPSRKIHIKNGPIDTRFHIFSIH